MSKDVTRRTTCRLCSSSALTLVLSLTPTPPANAFVDSASLGKTQKCYPLDVFFCEECNHLQLLDVVDPKILFEHYVYVSGTSPIFVRHFESYVRDIIETYPPPTGSLVVDIGSNDGTLLRFFKDAGCQVLGIDPAQEIAAAATKTGIETVPSFFSPELARRIRAERGPAHIVTANNVFAHADDLSGIVDGIRELLAPGGVFVFEVSYLLDVLEKTLFDTIYHEHLDYHSVKPLRRFFASRGMELIDTARIDTHGGSLRGVAQLTGGPRDVASSVNEMISIEGLRGLHAAQTFLGFSGQIDGIKKNLCALLQDLKGKGKSIAGFGAPAKATTLLYHFGIGPDIIDFIVDDSPLKQGLYSPGMHIPIVGSDAIYQRRPDYLVILAWNFAPSIMEKHKAYRANGGQFIVPLPTVDVH